MKTYTFIEKQGNAVIILSEESELDAWVYLRAIIKENEWNNFRLNSTEDE